MAEVRANGPAEFKYGDGVNAFTATTAKLHSIRLGHAIQDAKQVRRLRVEQIHTTQTPLTELVTSGQREALEKAYASRNNGALPPIKHQGSDHYLSLQFKECQRGQIGFFSDKQIISKLPDIYGAATRRAERRKPDGT